ncbi:MarR family winged helix-turn-helix transcriptional regulator [Pontibacter sp. G13]|uniref:MarR family winged helix-turn-helix transcriptional regulator n=1 Tax=Pontibacter sp. G13 TaxID=3074898 RepID=UPI00288AE715|nr:MarR family winged helix-turn-helix transcriptional regulator [Pontibacter sp. G13]WNJ16439.1 MarR family winged helix-turn-helix transcriptional regulator [Pontibacter sp. G13]
MTDPRRSSLGYMSRLLNQRLRERSELYFKQNGLPLDIPKYIVVYKLSQQSPLTVAQIADWEDTSPAFVWMQVANLLEDGYVKVENPGEELALRRLVLTDLAQEQMLAIMSCPMMALQDAFGDWEEEKKHEMVAKLNELVGNLEQSAPPASLPSSDHLPEDHPAKDTGE